MQGVREQTTGNIDLEIPRFVLKSSRRGLIRSGTQLPSHEGVDTLRFTAVERLFSDDLPRIPFAPFFCVKLHVHSGDFSR